MRRAGAFAPPIFATTGVPDHGLPHSLDPGDAAGLSVSAEEQQCYARKPAGYDRTIEDNGHVPTNLTSLTKAHITFPNDPKLHAWWWTTPTGPRWPSIDEVAQIQGYDKGLWWPPRWIAHSLVGNAVPSITLLADIAAASLFLGNDLDERALYRIAEQMMRDTLPTHAQNPWNSVP